jgi:hypothetical protein
MMKLLVTRNWKKPEYTIGRLFINGEFFCNTLEDTVRDLQKERKVKGQTAIPEGTYEVTLNVISPKYSKKANYKFCEARMPRLLGVPQFEGVLIHPGNSNKDTEGCLLVGENKVKGGLVNSFATFKRLWFILEDARKRKEQIQIEIRNNFV